MPTTFLGLLFALAFVPGWTYLTWKSKYRAPAESSALSDLLEIVAVGLATTGPGVLLLLIAPQRLPFTLDLGRWASQGDVYLVGHLRQAAMSAIIILLIAFALAWLYIRIGPARHSAGKEFLTDGGNVWVHALGKRGDGKLPWIRVVLTNETRIEGILHFQSTRGASDDRDLALKAPIFLTTPTSPRRRLGDIDRVVIPAREIRFITVQEVEPPEAAGKPSKPGS